MPDGSSVSADKAFVTPRDTGPSVPPFTSSVSEPIVTAVTFGATFVTLNEKPIELQLVTSVPESKSGSVRTMMSYSIFVPLMLLPPFVSPSRSSMLIGPTSVWPRYTP